jgi:hypothetical protein
MATYWPDVEMIDMPTGHSPFFVDVEGLAAVLTGAADRDQAAA